MKHTKTLKWMLTLACLLAALGAFTFSANASYVIDSGSCGDNLTWTLDDAGTLIISGTGEMNRYSFNQYNNGNTSFLYTTAPWSGPASDAHRVKTVVIKNGVTSIGDRAFFDCTGLTQVTIPNSVTSIRWDAFRGCTALTSVTIPDSVTCIERDAFSYCTGLTDLTIPDSATDIGCNAFYNTAWYDNQPDGLVYAGKVAYKYKGTMPQNTSIVLKNGTKGVSHSAFSRCTGLTDLTVPASVKSIGHEAFIGCKGLKKVNIRNIAKWCAIQFGNLYSNPLFYAHHLYVDGEEVTKLTIPDGVKSIAYAAFCQCTGLTSVVLPDSVTNIGKSAFLGCKGLASVAIPDSVTSIGTRAFYKCTGLTSVAIPNGVTSIGYYVFRDCTGLTSVTIPNSVKSIGNGSFYNCTALTSVTIPDSVTNIGYAAFCRCTGLKSLTIGNGVKSIEMSAFSNCTELISVTIPDSVTSIGNNAFHRDTLICGVKNSPAHQYAKANGNPFQFICKNGGDHQWDGGKITVEATDTEDGVMIYTCTVCGLEKIEPIPKTEPKNAPGDADGDGKLTSADARLALRASVGLKEPGDVEKDSAAYLACDVDGDGKVTSADARLILRASVGLEKLA